VTRARILHRLRAESRLSGLAAWRALVQLVNGQDLTHAAAIAYYALLSLFPFLLLTISLLGSVTGDEEDRGAVLAFVFQYFPTQLDFVRTQLDAFRQSSVQVGVVGGLALMWASLGVFGAVTSAVNEAWGVDKPRGFWKHRLVSFLMLVAAGATTMVALLVVSAVKVAEATWFGVVAARVPWLTDLRLFAFKYAATLLLTLAVGMVFYWIPHAKKRLRDVWVGAVLTGLLWAAAFDGFSWYIAANSRLTVIHGSIAAVVVFLLWIYTSSVILMYGVEFTAAYARLRRQGAGETAAAPATRDR
jgi:membrane protein